MTKPAFGSPPGPSPEEAVTRTDGESLSNAADPADDTRPGYAADIEALVAVQLAAVPGWVVGVRALVSSRERARVRAGDVACRDVIAVAEPRPRRPMGAVEIAAVGDPGASVSAARRCGDTSRGEHDRCDCDRKDPTLHDSSSCVPAVT